MIKFRNHFDGPWKQDYILEDTALKLKALIHQLPHIYVLYWLLNICSDVRN